MKTSYNNIEYIKKVAELQAKAMSVNPPAILFNGGKGKKDDEDDDTQTKKLKVKLEPTDKDSDEIEVKAFLFECGEAETWIKWQIQFEELERDMGLATDEQKIKVAKALLKGEARERFSTILNDIKVERAMATAIGPNPIGEFAEAIETLDWN